MSTTMTVDEVLAVLENGEAKKCWWSGGAGFELNSLAIEGDREIKAGGGVFHIDRMTSHNIRVLEKKQGKLIVVDNGTFSIIIRL